MSKRNEKKEKEAYEKLLKKKVVIAKPYGKEIDKSLLSDKLLPHQADIVHWAIAGGRRAIFASFGLGKTMMQLEIAVQVTAITGKPFLIAMPLGVVGEFKDDLAFLHPEKQIRYIKDTEDFDASEVNTDTIYVTNYERIRKGDIHAKYFGGVSFDEASIIRNLKTETTNFILKYFKDVPFRYVATATPTPNEFLEIINYADYLGVIDRGHALTRFFQRDSTKAGNLTLYPHKKDEFWKWVSTWAVFINKPSDLGHQDDGYILPKLNVIERVVVNNPQDEVIKDKFGTAILFKDTSKGLVEASREKKESIEVRVQEMKNIIEENPNENWLIWHHRDAERDEIEDALKSFNLRSLTGSQSTDEKEEILNGFKHNKFQVLSTKPKIAGSGCNFQHACWNMIFVGINYEFNDFIQAVHRCYRFKQVHEVNIYIIYTQNEYEILKALKKKWAQHIELQSEMINIVREYGLNIEKIQTDMQRQIFTKRQKAVVGGATVYNEDTVTIHQELESNSLDMILTSIPFGDHYEYSDNYNDMGHNHGNDEFFKQMSFLTPNLLRCLKPGKIAAIHVKDRIRYSYQNGTGFTTLEDFSGRTVAHFTKQDVKDKIDFLEDMKQKGMALGEDLERELEALKEDYKDRFYLMGKITITTDVVMENNQTYRLGWSEQCKDATKMGVGSPEYVLIFRKAPSENNNAYADEPVTHDKEEYTRARWQLDAHAYWKSSGNRLLSSKEIASMDLKRVVAYWKEHNTNPKNIYDFQEHLQLCEDLDDLDRLSAKFMTLPLHSNSEAVWTDINRMLTLNASQANQKKEKHICLAAGTLILTQRGYIPIEDIIVDKDMTITHTGQWKRIIAKEQTRKDTEVVQIKAQGVPFLITTPDHKIYLKKHKGYRPSETFVHAQPEWVQAQDCATHYVNQKLAPVIEQDLSELDCWIIGRWLADGHIDYRGHQYFISVGKDKIEEFESKCKGYFGAKNMYGSCTQYGMINLGKNVRDILSKCGRGAVNKNLPIELISLNKELSKSLIMGYLSGDGHLDKNGIYHASSVSRPLLLGLSLVAQRAFDVIPSVYSSKKAGVHTIEGRKVNVKQLWVMTINIDKKNYHSKILEDGAWKKVKSVESVGRADVWNIRVEDDASYTAEGCIVKNCPLQLDIIERLIERYTNKGDLICDPFGGLFSTAYKAIQMGRRAISVELNPSYYADGLFYLKSIEYQINVPTLFDVME